MEEIKAALYELFKHTFVTNCEIEESPMTQDEIETLEDLDAFEIIDNLKDVVSELLALKKKIKNTETSDLIKKAEQFENMLQKLESDIRGHIRCEQQLKLQLDLSKSKLEEYERKDRRPK